MKRSFNSWRKPIHEAQLQFIPQAIHSCSDRSICRERRQPHRRPDGHGKPCPYDNNNSCLFLLCSVFAKQSVSFPLKARCLLLLSVVTKVSKNTLVPVVRKYSKSPCQFGSVFSSLQFLLTLGIGNKSLLIGDFEVSALCLSSALYRTALFKTTSLKCVRWSLLL